MRVGTTLNKLIYLILCRRNEGFVRGRFWLSLFPNADSIKYAFFGTLENVLFAVCVREINVENLNVVWCRNIIIDYFFSLDKSVKE